MVFEQVTEDARIPRVVIEFKTRVSTHDVLTYDAKAAKHKTIYPYLRYGLLASAHAAVPGRAFTHNQALDFLFATDGLSSKAFDKQFADLLEAEVEASLLLQQIAYDGPKVRLFRTQPVTVPVLK